MPSVSMVKGGRVSPAVPRFFFLLATRSLTVLSLAPVPQLTPLLRGQLQRAGNAMDGIQSRRDSQIGLR